MSEGRGRSLEELRLLQSLDIVLGREAGHRKGVRLG